MLHCNGISRDSLKWRCRNMSQKQFGISWVCIAIYAVNCEENFYKKYCVALVVDFFTRNTVALVGWGWKQSRLGNPSCHIVWPWFCRILIFTRSTRNIFRSNRNTRKFFLTNTLQKCPQKYCGIGREAGETWKSYLPALSPPGAHRPIHCTGKIFRTSENQLICWKYIEDILRIWSWRGKYSGHPFEAIDPLKIWKKRSIMQT